MPFYRKKPVVIEARRITDETFDNPHPNPEHFEGVTYDPYAREAVIDTLEGTMYGSLGDYLVKGIKGEIYPCKPDIFEATYDPAED